MDGLVTGLPLFILMYGARQVLMRPRWRSSIATDSDQTLGWQDQIPIYL